VVFGTVTEQLHRMMTQTGVLGKKQGQSRMTMYERRIHSFRRFGIVEMQRAKVIEDVISNCYYMHIMFTIPTLPLNKRPQGLDRS
jgi:hypothetical protein